MATVADALVELNITGFSLVGEPTNEEEFNSSFKKYTGKSASGKATFATEPSMFGVTWEEVETKLAELNAAEPLKLLKQKRNQLLAECDWVAGEDVPQSIKDTWFPYRQALRDITETYSSIDDVVWPDKPE